MKSESRSGFPSFFIPTPVPSPKEKRRILPESTLALWIRDHSGVDPSGALTNWVIDWFCLFNNSSQCICFGSGFLALARNTLTCTLRHSAVNVSKPTVDPPLS